LHLLVVTLDGETHAGKHARRRSAAVERMRLLN
jgi:hypothetical protein